MLNNPEHSTHISQSFVKLQAKDYVMTLFLPCNNSEMVVRPKWQNMIFRALTEIAIIHSISEIESSFFLYSVLFLSNSRLSLKTKSWLCFTPVTRRTTRRTRTRTPHQNLSDGSVLEGWNLTHRLLMGFWLSLGGQGSMSQEEQEQQQKFESQIFFRPKFFSKLA